MKHPKKLVALSAAALALGFGGAAACESTAPPEQQPAGQSAEDNKPKHSVKLQAEEIPTDRSVAADPTRKYTTLQVTVTNQSNEPVDVNPLGFAAVDSNGGKHQSLAMGVAKNYLKLTTLNKGEHVTGSVAFPSEFDPETMEFLTNGGLNVEARTEVAP